MSQKQFFKEGKWLSSFLLFGNRQIVYHHPITVQGQQSRINRMFLNQSYPNQEYLAARLCEQTYHLTKQLRKSSQSYHSVIISHLRNMMNYVAKVQTQSYHNILYLTFKYLAHLVSKEAIQQSVPIEDEVSLESWLADIHAIYFQTAISNNVLPETNSQEQLLSLLKKGDYQAMISKLRYLYCTIAKEDKSTLEKIDLLITLLLIRVNNKAYNDLNRRGSQQQFSNLGQRLIQNYKEKFTKIFQNDKKQGNKKGVTDTYTIVGRVLMGEEVIHEKVAEKSWPLYIMNYLNFGNGRLEKLSLPSIVLKFLSKFNHYGKASAKQTQYLLKLLGDQSSHQIYQSLFQIVPPFYAHLIGYFLSFIQPNPIATVFVEEYTLDIVRNVLDHGSQISFQSLIYLCANFEQTSISGDRLAEIFEPLLVQHLCVIDDSDREQLKSLLLKVRLMSDLNLQRYVYSELNLLVNNLLQRGVLNREVLLVYAFCSTLFFNYYNYQELLAYYLQKIFMSGCFTVNFLEQYRTLKSQIQATRDKKILKELNRIEPLLEKFFRLEIALKEPDIGQKIDHLIDLLQKTYRSVTVLRVVLDLLLKLSTTTISFTTFAPLETKQRQLAEEVSQFLTHYPSERGEQEASLIAAIEQIIN